MNPVLEQSGEIVPGSGIATFFPSIWVDDDGNAAITMARSATNELISMSRAVRLATDPAGTFQPIEFVRVSNSTYTGSRWGDYSGTSDDPWMPGSFWGIHEYATGTNSWNTWIARYDIVVPPEDVVPDSLNMFRGFLTGGGVGSLADSDDDYVTAIPGFTLNAAEAPVWIELDGAATVGTASDLMFTIESALNTPNIEQTTELFNFDTNDWEVVDTRINTLTDSTAQIIPAGDVNRFVDGPGTVRARIGWRRAGFLTLYPWTVRVDQVFWTITP